MIISNAILKHNMQLDHNVWLSVATTESFSEKSESG